MRLPATAKWIGLALLGLVIAAAVAIAASNLVSQQIGIASESVSAGDSLVPKIGAASTEGNKGSGGESTVETNGGEERTSTTPSQPPATTAPTQPPTTTVPTQPSERPADDHGGGGSGGGGGGHEGSDD